MVWDATVPPFDAGGIRAAPSHGPSRTWRSLCPKQDHPVASQRALSIAPRPRYPVVDILPPYLLFGLGVMGMENAEKGPGVKLLQLRLSVDVLVHT